MNLSEKRYKLLFWELSRNPSLIRDMCFLFSLCFFFFPRNILSINSVFVVQFSHVPYFFFIFKTHTHTMIVLFVKCIINIILSVCEEYFFSLLATIQIIIYISCTCLFAFWIFFFCFLILLWILIEKNTISCLTEWVCLLGFVWTHKCRKIVSDEKTGNIYYFLLSK